MMKSGGGAVAFLKFSMNIVNLRRSGPAAVVENEYLPKKAS